MNRFITGEKFKTLADYIYTPAVKYQDDFNDYGNTLNIDLLKDGDIIYTHTMYVRQLFEVIKGVNKKLILISHNCDAAANIIPPGCIVKWYSQNVNIIDSRVESIPIGLENNRWFPDRCKKMKILIKSQELRKYRNLRIESYEDNFNWMQNTYIKYSADNYHFHHVDSWDSFFEKTIFSEIYDLVFVDSSPWDARIQAIEAVKDKTKVIILHDYDWFNKGVIEDIYSIGKGSFYDTKYGNDFKFEGYREIYPGTLIMRKKECKHPVDRVEIIDFNSGQYYCCKCKKMIIIKIPKE